MAKNFFRTCLFVLSLGVLTAISANAQDASKHTPAGDIRHELATLPYYNVFDWIDGEVQADGNVILRGEVIRPSTRSDAEERIRKIEGVTKIVNDIQVLPLSPSDDHLRLSLYRAIYNFNSPLFRYSTQAVPPIHIVVNNGRAELKGAVADSAESQIAYAAARQVPGLFDVKNELSVDN